MVHARRYLRWKRIPESGSCYRIAVYSRQWCLCNVLVMAPQQTILHEGEIVSPVLVAPQHVLRFAISRPNLQLGLPYPPLFNSLSPARKIKLIVKRVDRPPCRFYIRETQLGTFVLSMKLCDPHKTTVTTVWHFRPLSQNLQLWLPQQVSYAASPYVSCCQRGANPFPKLPVQHPHGGGTALS